MAFSEEKVLSEDRLIELAMLAQDSFRSQLQWWLGVSIGVAALGHFIVRKLNLALLVLICVLYVTFTYLTLIQLSRFGAIYDGLLEDLARVSESGEVSVAAQRLLEQGLSAGSLVALLAFLGTFLGCLAFLVWSFVQARKKIQISL